MKKPAISNIPGICSCAKVMWMYKFLLLTLVGFCVAKDELEISLRHGLTDYLKTGHKSNELQHAFNALKLPQLFRRDDNRGIVEGAVCMTCKVSVDVIISAKQNGASKETLIGLIIELCIGLKIESDAICHGAVKAQADSLMYIIDNKPDLTSKRVCSILLQGFGCKDRDRVEWEIEIPPQKEVDAPEKVSKSTSFKILQLSDLHYDPAYENGSNAACDEPLCCQAGSVPSTPEDAAGVWGDYRQCDTPWHGFVDYLNHIIAQHKDIDLVYFTGDIINHKVWDTNIEDNTKAITDVLQQLKESFGSTVVYPILGNHEPHPVNLFSSDDVDHPDLTTQWVYDLVAEQWKSWLPVEARDTILRGGYYTVLVKPGFRIIALNSNVCYTFNWWLLYDDVDPYGQLQWLVEVLLNAEQNGETVHILSHIPTGDTTCLLNWSREYTKIINRFAHTIAAQFNGHTHHDETVIFFNTTNSSQAINVAFNGGSLTPWYNLNPNYKIYDIDLETMEVTDFESWSYNLTEANLTPDLSPNWFKLYSFKSTYGIDNLNPQEIAKLTERMARNRSLTELYFRLKYREADSALDVGCDDECHLKNLCYMVTYHAEHTSHCEYITEIFNSARRKLSNK